MSKGRTILLVEDEAIIALAGKQLLEREGYEVIRAPTGEKAVEIATDDNRRIDLVLMDIDLGAGIDGTEAAQRILATRPVPVLFLSSHTEKEYTDRADHITSYGYVVKQSGDTVLLTSIKMAFRLFEAKRALGESNKRLTEYLQMSQAVTAATDIGSLAELIVSWIAEVTPAQHNAVFVVHGPDTIRRLVVVESGHDDSSDRFLYADLRNHPHVRKAIDTERPVNVTDTSTVDWTPEEREIVDMLDLRTILYMPMRYERGTVGVLNLGVAGVAYSFTDEEIALLRGFATEIARLIEKVSVTDESQAKVGTLRARLPGKPR